MAQTDRTMRAVQLDEWGPATNMRLRQVPVPEPTPDQLRIEVHTAGVIFADIMLREQRYVIDVPLPHCPGREVAGVVDKVGSAVSGFDVGDPVMATMIGGAYAEYAIVLPAVVLPDGRRIPTTFKLPDRASFESSLVYLTGLRTAYLACRVVHKLQPEETVLVHAASGCVGGHVVRLAKKNGNTVIALVSRDEKALRCRELGAAHVVNLSKTDYVQEVLRLTSGSGVDCSFNSVGGATLKTDPHAIATFGTLIIFGSAGGKALIDPYDPIEKKAQTIKTFSSYPFFGTSAFQEATDFVNTWLEKEPLESPQHVFPLEAACEAHQLIESRASSGKVVLDCLAGTS
jgi:NADPH2:quinone reductase